MLSCIRMSQMSLLGCQKDMRRTHSGCRNRIEKRAGVGFSGGQEGGGKPTMIPISVSHSSLLTVDSMIPLLDINIIRVYCLQC